MGGCFRTQGGGVAVDPAAHGILHSQQAGSQQDQIGHQCAKEPLFGPQEQDTPDNAANGRDRQEQTESVLLAAQIVALGPGCPEVAKTKRHGVGNIGRHRRNADCDQHRKSDQRTTAGQGVDRPTSHGSQSDEK